MKNLLLWRVLGILSAGCLAFNSPAENQPPFRIGLNFPFVGAPVLNIANTLTNLADLGVRGLRHPTPADTGWGSIQTSSGGAFNFTTSDSVFFKTNQCTSIGMLYADPNPAGTAFSPNPGLQVPWMTNVTGFGFTPAELNEASNYVTTVVAHYTNATHLWEVSNEVSGTNTPPRSLPPDKFAAYMVTNRIWIHSVDPQATVLLSGCLGSFGLPFTNNYAWLRTLLSNGGTNGFDAMNYHDYKSWWVLATNYDGYRSVLNEFGLSNMPIWVTESSSSSVANQTAPPYASEDQQAADVWRRSSLLFGKGASVWFWHSLYSATTGGFAHQGLITSITNDPPGQKKKAWHSFKLLVEKIEGFQSAKMLQLGNATNSNTVGGDGQWAVQFDWSDGTRRYVAWSGTNLNYTLASLDSNASPYRVTVVVPSVLTSSNEVATFTVTTNIVSGNSLLLTGTNLPVVVESTLTPFQIWANTKISNTAQRGQTDDPDGDGQNNYAEFLAGTEPNNANSVFKLTGISREAAGCRIYWSSATNKNYSVLRATALTNFSTVQTNLAATPPTNSWLDTNVANATLFYRVQLN